MKIRFEKKARYVLLTNTESESSVENKSLQLFGPVLFWDLFTLRRGPPSVPDPFGRFLPIRGCWDYTPVYRAIVARDIQLESVATAVKHTRAQKKLTKRMIEFQ